MTDEELKQKLTPEEYKVLREKGTEMPYSGKYYQHFEPGMYSCKVCGNQLFSSDTKYDGSQGPGGLRGWPTFDQAIPGAVKFFDDTSDGTLLRPGASGGHVHRTEVTCANCGSHLGHGFDDDTAKTGKHFCINSVCLGFEEKK